jgi:predicted nucleic acid-binding protein
MPFRATASLAVTTIAKAVLLRVRELRNSLTAHDAVYVTLAEALAAPLLTTDSKLAHAHGHQATVELL